MTKVTDEQVKVTVQAGAAADASFSYEIASIKNPYSPVKNGDIEIQHFPGCVTTGAATPLYQGVKPSLGTQFAVSTASAGTPTATITPKASGADNVVATTDGNVAITLPASELLPKYGGIMLLVIPKWYEDATTTVFNVSPKTTCSNANLLAVVDTPQSTDVNSNQHYFYFREFTGSAASPVTITCDNYNNPIYDDAAVGPFTISVTDNEVPPNAIGTYTSFYFSAVGLKPR